MWLLLQSRVHVVKVPNTLLIPSGTLSITIQLLSHTSRRSCDVPSVNPKIKEQLII